LLTYPYLSSINGEQIAPQIITRGDLFT